MPQYRYQKLTSVGNFAASQSQSYESGKLKIGVQIRQRAFDFKITI
jgi:hypothetical protein